MPSFTFASPTAPARTDALAASFATTYAGVVAFIAVAGEGSFARAAERLGIGRSAVSRSVQRLEDQLNVRLFRRTTRSTALTHEGDLFYARCHSGVDRIVEAVEEMREMREGPPRGHLRISSPVSFGRTVVAPLLREFQATYPDVAIDLLLSDKPTDFISDRVDIAFRSGLMQDAEFIAKQIAAFPMLVCASPAYQQTHGLPESLEDVARHRCIALRLSPAHVVDWDFEVDGERRRASPPAKLTYNDDELVLQAVLAGQGIAQLPGYLVGELVERNALVSCLGRYAPADRGYFICYLSRQHLPTRMRAFIDFMTTRIRTANPRVADSERHEALEEPA